MKASRRPKPPATAKGMDWTGVAARHTQYEPGGTIYAQGDTATAVMYIERGAVRLSVVSHKGKEAVVAAIGAGHFFGEGCLAGQPTRMSTARVLETSAVVAIERSEMARLLQVRPAFAEQFLTHMLTRNIRIEEDLIDQLFNSSEKRLARTLLLLGRYGEAQADHRELPKVSQAILAEMVGTTRPRINFFMNKFRRLGFIDYDDGGLRIHNSLLTVVLRD